MACFWRWSQTHALSLPGELVPVVFFEVVRGVLSTSPSSCSSSVSGSSFMPCSDGDSLSGSSSSSAIAANVFNDLKWSGRTAGVRVDGVLLPGVGAGACLGGGVLGGADPEGAPWSVAVT